jgi:hypothetical protein
MAQDKVNVCWNFSSEKCEFGEVKCNICEKVFENQGNFMQHKKSGHSKNV